MIFTSSSVIKVRFAIWTSRINFWKKCQNPSLNTICLEAMEIKERTWERVKQEFILFRLFIFRPQNASSHEHSLTMRYRLCRGFVRKVFVFLTRVNVERYNLIFNANTITTHAFGQLLVAYHHNGLGGGMFCKGCFEYYICNWSIRVCYQNTIPLIRP